MWSETILVLLSFLSSVTVSRGQQGQIVSGSTTFPLNEDTENCANRVQQVNPKKPGLAVSKCLKTPLSTPAPDEPYFDPGGCSKLQLTPQEGETVTLKCKVGNLGLNKITWIKTIKGHPTMISYGNDLAIRNDPRISLVGNLNNTFDLEIEQIDADDEGIYRCQVAGTQKSWNITIKVQVPPSIKSIDMVDGSDGVVDERLNRKFIYNETDTIQLKCNPDGYPLPTVKWTKANERTTILQRGQNLLIRNASRNDSGVYACEVMTYLGPGVDSFSEKREAIKQIQIIVQYKPEVCAKRVDIREPLGEYAQLECSVNANPTATYEWRKGNETVPEQQSQIDKPKSTRIPLVCKDDKTRLIILSIDPDDYGNYTCTATNSLGSDTAFIELSGKPRKPSIKSGNLSNKKHRYKLVWTNGDNGTPGIDAKVIPVDMYIIQYQGWWYVKTGNKKKGESMKMQFSHQPPLVETHKPTQGVKRHTYMLRDLRQNITYDVYLYARNKYGDGLKAFLQFRTNIEDLEDPVTTPQPTPQYGQMEESKVWNKIEKRFNGSPTISISRWLVVFSSLISILTYLCNTLS